MDGVIYYDVMFDGVLEFITVTKSYDTAPHRETTQWKYYYIIPSYGEYGDNMLLCVAVTVCRYLNHGDAFTQRFFFFFASWYQKLFQTRMRVFVRNSFIPIRVTTTPRSRYFFTFCFFFHTRNDFDVISE